jgi:acetyltransferase-like isoleucine patch superfamily enzyme
MDIISLLYRAPKRKLNKMLFALHRHNILKHVKGGEGLHLEGKITVINEENLTLGRNVHIGKGAYIHCQGGITIGDYTILSRQVTIYSYDHNFKNPDLLPYDEQALLKPVHIGRYVWIGMNVTIAPGTTIGDGAIVGMGSVVSGNVPENAIIVSPKLRIIGYRDAEHTKKLALEERFYNSPERYRT